MIIGPRSGRLLLVDRRRDRDDVERAVGELRRIGGQLELASRTPSCSAVTSQRVVVALLQLVDPTLADIEADRRQLAAERERDRQADVAEADDRNLLLFEEAHREEESMSIPIQARRVDAARVRVDAGHSASGTCALSRRSKTPRNRPRGISRASSTSSCSRVWCARPTRATASMHAAALACSPSSSKPVRSTSTWANRSAPSSSTRASCGTTSPARSTRGGESSASEPRSQRVENTDVVAVGRACRGERGEAGIAHVGVDDRDRRAGQVAQREPEVDDQRRARRPCRRSARSRRRGSARRACGARSARTPPGLAHAVVELEADRREDRVVDVGSDLVGHGTSLPRSA